MGCSNEIKIARLGKGEVLELTAHGSSMSPIIKNGDRYRLEPCSIEEAKVGDIVFCKVKGRYFTPLVTAIGDKGCLISNNRGHNNGWTRSIYGRVIR